MEPGRECLAEQEAAPLSREREEHCCCFYLLPGLSRTARGWPRAGPKRFFELPSLVNLQIGDLTPLTWPSAVLTPEDLTVPHVAFPF